MYKQNYLKYKNKYLELKNQIYDGVGGGLDDNVPKYFIEITFKAIQYNYDGTTKEITIKKSYFIPSIFKPEHHTQLEDLIIQASKSGLINSKLRQMDIHSSPTHGLVNEGKDNFMVTNIKFARYTTNDTSLESIDSIEILLTDFNSKDYCVIILEFYDGDKKMNILHPFPNDMRKYGTDSYLVSQYKELYPKLVISKVSFNDINSILTDSKKSRFLRYWTPSQLRIKPIPTTQELRITELESKMTKLEAIIYTMQEKISEMQSK